MAAGSRIIFFSSSLTRATTVLPNSLVYIASKGAVEQMARALAKDLGSRGITVNTVSPGPTDTPLFRQGKPEQVITFIASLNPSKRLGTPQEMSGIVAFLAGPEATWINGQNIPVNGVSSISFWRWARARWRRMLTPLPCRVSLCKLVFRLRRRILSALLMYYKTLESTASIDLG